MLENIVVGILTLGMLFFTVSSIILVEEKRNEKSVDK